jgi:N-acetylglucosaminyl-diphospho-decaprenol L-rhamnosyltransferase
MSVAGIIVNYRTPELAGQALGSLVRELAPVPGSHVYLVDNASGDHSLPFLEQAIERASWRTLVTLLPAPKNGGFGYGINLAVRRALAEDALPDYFYVLNPDAEVEPGSLGRLLAFAERHPEAGLLGSHIRGTDGRSQVAAFRYPSFWGELENAASLGLLTRLLARHVVCPPPPAQDCPVDWISGTSMLIRRSTFESVGLFDEEFFLYFEEVDFCRRARRAGIPTWFVTGAPITHVGAAATGMMDETRPMPAYWFASRYRYFRKHHGPAYAAACDLARVLGTIAWRVKERALGRPAKSRPSLLRDLVAASCKHLRAGG